MIPENWGPGDRKFKEIYQAMEKPKARGLKEYITMNLFGRWHGNRNQNMLYLTERNGDIN